MRPSRKLREAVGRERPEFKGRRFDYVIKDEIAGINWQALDINIQEILQRNMQDHEAKQMSDALLACGAEYQPGLPCYRLTGHAGNHLAVAGGNSIEWDDSVVEVKDVLTREVLEKARDAVLASCPCGGDRRHNCNGSEDYFEHLGRLQREEIARVERVMPKERDVPLKPPIRASLVPCQRPDRHPGHLFYDGLGDAAFWCDGVDWP